MPAHHDALTFIDVYKAEGLEGNDVYTKFYFNKDTGKLYIQSFKALYENEN
jgi:hypothetical protein